MLTIHSSALSLFFLVITSCLLLHNQQILAKRSQHQIGKQAKFECGQIPMAGRDWPAVHRGRRNLHDRIAFGLDSADGQFPAYVAIRIRIDKSSNKFSECGGGLINREWILTAAHCLDSDGLRSDDIRVVHTIYYNTSWGESGVPNFVRTAKAFCLHPKFKEYEATITAVPYDVALIKLNKPIEYNERVQPACIYIGDIPDDAEIYFAGLGGIDAGNPGGDPPERLQFMRQRRQKCVWRELKDNPNVMCTNPANETGTSCTGDSGGPIFWRKNGLLLMLGVVSAADTVACDAFSNGQQANTLFKTVPFNEMLVACNQDHKVNHSEELRNGFPRW